MQENECFHTDLCKGCAELFDALDDDPLPFGPVDSSACEDIEPVDDCRARAFQDMLMRPDPTKWDELKKAVEVARKERGNSV